MAYRVELAPTGWTVCHDSQCQRFEYKIPQGALRFGTWVDLPFMCCGQWKWKHWGCVSGKQLQNLQAAIYNSDGAGGDVYDWAKIEGFDELAEFPELQARVRRVVAQGHIDDEDFNGVQPMCNTPGRTGIRRRGTITPSPIKVGPIIIPVVPVPIALARDQVGTKHTFVITGIFSAMTQDEAKAMVLSIGGVVESTPTENTSYAVVGMRPAPWKVACFGTHGINILNEQEFLEFIIQRGDVKQEDGTPPTRSAVKTEMGDSKSGMKKEEETADNVRIARVKKEETTEKSWESSGKEGRNIAVKQEEPSITLVSTNAKADDTGDGSPAVKREKMVIVKEEEADEVVFLTAVTLNTRKRTHVADDEEDEKGSLASKGLGGRIGNRSARIQQSPATDGLIPQAGRARGHAYHALGDDEVRDESHGTPRGKDGSRWSGPGSKITRATATVVGLRRSTRNKAPPT
ncbi:uncharacterized protein PG986_007999 [Apiospora aurea]|uniref:BRCT domain-containing protein n=1 Tax=Apiospora aurea TaxID=335848 RepID=A0ABR1QE67_9PEZI